MAAKTKAGRSAASKKAWRTRKRRAKKKGVTSAVAKKAYAAGRGVEKKYAARLRKKNNDQAYVSSGIPDILAHDRGGWKFYEVKPHMKRSGYKKNGRWYVAGDKGRLLNKHQLAVFRQLVSKGEEVNMVYYYRKKSKYGTKANPRYIFRYNEVKLQTKHFKSKCTILHKPQSNDERTSPSTTPRRKR